MSSAHLKILHNSTLCAQIYHINSSFLQTFFYTKICDRFEILKSQMQSVAPSAVENWENALIHGHFGIGVFLKEFGVARGAGALHHLISGLSLVSCVFLQSQD